MLQSIHHLDLCYVDAYAPVAGFKRQSLCIKTTLFVSVEKKLSSCTHNLVCTPNQAQVKSSTQMILNAFTAQSVQIIESRDGVL